MKSPKDHEVHPVLYNNPGMYVGLVFSLRCFQLMRQKLKKKKFRDLKIKYLNLKLGSSDLKAYIRSIPPYWSCRCRTFNEEMNERHVTHVSHGKQPVMLGEVCTVIVIKTAIKEANICEGLVRFCLFVTYWGILKQIFLLLDIFS